MLFIDCNYPGVIYSGEPAHMRGLGAVGGCPARVSEAFAERMMRVGDPIEGRWEAREAPDFWVGEGRREALRVAVLNLRWVRREVGGTRAVPA